MPKKTTPKTPTTPRCSYKEDGRRCIKNATLKVGGIALCGLHAQVMAKAAQPTRTGIAGLGDLATDVISDLFAGRPLNREKIATAINEAAWDLGQNYAPYQPPIQDVPIQDPTGNGAPPRRGIRDLFNDWARAAPVDPAKAHRQAEVKKARAVLGFGPAEKITPEVLKARHRELSKKHHPDRGGSVDRMQEINAAVDTVQASLYDPP